MSDKNNEPQIIEAVEVKPAESQLVLRRDLAVSRDPDIVLEEATKAARALQKVISAKPKKVIINGEQYLEFEDWLTVARFYGCTVRVRSTQFVQFGDVRGYEATAEVLRDGNVISAATSMCLDDESRWENKPLFQILSMSQTRACAKALRNVLSWVVVLAGYRATPAEEMYDGAEKERQHPGPKPAPKPATPVVVPKQAAPAPKGPPKAIIPPMAKVEGPSDGDKNVAHVKKLATEIGCSGQELVRFVTKHFGVNKLKEYEEKHGKEKSSKQLVATLGALEACLKRFPAETHAFIFENPGGTVVPALQAVQNTFLAEYEKGAKG